MHSEVELEYEKPAALGNGVTYVFSREKQVSSPLLKTKIHIPGVRSELMSRSRLIDRLNAALQRRLILISAPAGFGKTTLLSDWVQQTDASVAWVSLDPDDNDPARFLAYVIAALQSESPELGATALSALQSRQPPPLDALLTDLINEITTACQSEQRTRPCALVLDDFHVITDQQVHGAVVFLLDHMPSQMHLVLSSRSDPSWPLARRRARGEMAELRASDLRFTPEEAASFLNEVMGLGLSGEDVASLEQRTEGWIAGLQMAALSMQGREDASGFIRAFAGTNRFILDYLAEEVLDRQSRTIQEFLLRTSILARMTASLCDAVLGTGSATDPVDGQEALEQLERANLFVVPLDDERRWYRYHHLFGDLLHGRLRKMQPDLVPALHLRASTWYEENGLIADAVSHALAANDLERVAYFVEGNALTVMERGEMRTMIGWLDALPDDIVRARPWLCISHAWALAYLGELDAVEPLLQDAERALMTPPGAQDGPGDARLAPESAVFYGDRFDGRVQTEAEAERIRGHIAAIRALDIYIRGDPSSAGRLAREALEHLPEGDLRARGFVTAALGAMLKWSGDLMAATQMSKEAVVLSRAAGDIHVAVHAVCDLGALAILQGQLHQAVATCRKALHMGGTYAGRGGRQVTVAGHAYALLSAVCLEWNEPEAALQHAQDGIGLCRLCGQADVLTTGCRSLAWALQATGNAEGALEMMEEASRIASSTSTWYRTRGAAWEAALHLDQGDKEAASRWARESGVSASDDLSFHYESVYRTLARVLIAQDKLDQALILLDRLLALEELAGATGCAIDVLTMQAIALQMNGDAGQALRTLERALNLAEPEGYVRTFASGGAPMKELLRRSAHLGVAPAYLTKLLAELDRKEKRGRQAQGQGREPASQRPPDGGSSVAEPLSERELQVLHLLDSHLSSTEIADQLIVSVNTARSHIKNIYSKLNAHSRSEAVQRAKEFGLL